MKTGWLESKIYDLLDRFGFTHKDIDDDKGTLGSLVVPFSSYVQHPSKTETYINDDNILRVVVVDEIHGVSNDGELIVINSNSFALNEEYKQCPYCNIYMRHNVWFKHTEGKQGSEALLRGEKPNTVPPCEKHPMQDIATGKAILTNDGYKEIFKRTKPVAMVEYVPAFNKEDIEDLTTDVDNLEPEGIYAGLYLVPDHICEDCSSGNPVEGICLTRERPEIGYETMDALGNKIRVIGTMERFVEVGRDPFKDSLRRRRAELIDKHWEATRVTFRKDQHFKLVRGDKLYPCKFVQPTNHEVFPILPSNITAKYSVRINARTSYLVMVNSEGSIFMVLNGTEEVVEFTVPSDHLFVKCIEATIPIEGIV